MCILHAEPHCYVRYNTSSLNHKLSVVTRFLKWPHPSASVGRLKPTCTCKFIMKLLYCCVSSVFLWQYKEGLLFLFFLACGKKLKTYEPYVSRICNSCWCLHHSWSCKWLFLCTVYIHLLHMYLFAHKNVLLNGKISVCFLLDHLWMDLWEKTVWMRISPNFPLDTLGWCWWWWWWWWWCAATQRRQISLCPLLFRAATNDNFNYQLISVLFSN